MAQQYQPKPISFAPPILRRKFIAPDNPRELGNLVILVGLAILLVSMWANVSDIFVTIGKRSTTGEFVATAPYRSGNALRMVGVYVFKDESGVPMGVRGERVFVRKAKIPKKAHVVWPRGRPGKAQVTGEYYDYLFGVPVGLAVIGFGFWVRRKRVDPYETAMNTQEDTPGEPT
jgi:hypothetical protein